MGHPTATIGRAVSVAVVTATAVLGISVPTHAVESTVAVATGVGVRPPTATSAPPTHAIRTRFGATATQLHGQSLAGAMARQRGQYGPLGVVRLFYAGLPAPWGRILPAVGGTPVSVSFKIAPARVLSGAYDTALRTWFLDAPANRRTFWTYFHEPEDNIERGQFTAGRFRAAWKHIADIAARTTAASGAHLRATLILMCWTASPHSRRDWRAYVSAGNVQVLGWDCYNAGARQHKYGDPATLMDDAMSVAKKLDLPWAITELGSVLITGDNGTGRARWLSAISVFATKHHARFVSYFDTNVGTDYRLLDGPSVRTWAANTPL